MQSQDDIWKYILDALGRNLPPTVISAWFDDVKIVELTEDTLVLYTPPAFKRDMLQRYVPAIKDALFELFGSHYLVEILIQLDMEGYQKQQSMPSSSSGHSDFVFDNFVVGPSNNFAYAASMSAAENPGKIHNPLFIYGGSGLGKTHLLYAIMNKIKENIPDMIIRVFSAEQFTNELVSAIQVKKTEDFRNKYRSAGLMLVDDIQFIARTEFAQEEFFHTFDALHNAGSQIVITSDRPPRDLPLLVSRLRTRFESGLIIDVAPPDRETRIVLIRIKAQRLGMTIPMDVVEYMADIITSNVRQLEGSVKKLKALKDIESHENITMELAQRAVADILTSNPGLNPTPELIISEVCSYYSLNERELLGDSRQAETAYARQVAMFLVKKLTDLNSNDIGKKVFNRDRTTIKHALQKIEAQRMVNPALEADLCNIEENIRGH